MPGTLPEELVETDLRTDHRGRTWAIVTAVLERHPARVDPACVQFRGCPGCPLRHAQATWAAAWKLEAARRTFARLAGRPAPPGTLLEPVGRDGFRARLSATVIGETLGMNALPGEPAVDLSACPAQTNGSRTALARLREDLRDAGVLDAVLRASVAAADDTGEVRVALSAVDRAGLARLVAADLPKRPLWSVFAKFLGPRDVDLESGATALYGSATMHFEAGGDRFQATMPAWVPQAPGTLDALRRCVVERLEPAGAAVLELGCGVGTTSLALARLARRFIGVDCVREAIVDANENARRAGVTGANFRLGFADRAVRRLVASGERFDAVLLHGMRGSFGARLMDVLPATGAQRVVYLAPITASLARDTVHLRGLELIRLDFIDQMPGTAHLMAIGVFARPRPSG